MTEFSRRIFLKYLASYAAAAAALQLTGCQGQQSTPETIIIRQTATPLPATPTPAPTPTPKPSRLAVTRNGEPEDLVRTAVNALGGMEKFVNKGDEVVVKPNICVAAHTYEYASTTNPFVVGTLVRMAYEAGASKVKVMDRGFSGSPEKAYVVSGIQEQVEAAGGEMVLMSDLKYVPLEIPQGWNIYECLVYQDILDADVLINVPVAKTHGLAKLTLSMKNLMGIIENRPIFHAVLPLHLAHLNSIVKSDLVVVDAVRMMMENGPTGGSLDYVKKADTVIASDNVVAADSYGATLFGMKPSDYPTAKEGAAMGLGENDLSSVVIEEINLS
jgi:uncharacterized protein (DUF362 family)